MSNKKKQKQKQKRSMWLPPKGYQYYFDAASDEEFKARHPIGYGFLVLLAIIALVLPAVLFCVLVGSGDNGWVMLGFVGGFIVGIGLFNFVAIIIKQYLGHLVSLVCFAVGGGLMALSWFLCR